MNLRQTEILKGIEVRGANAGNLKNVACDIPHNTFTILLGPSGSGKSSFLTELSSVSSVRPMEIILHGHRGNSDPEFKKNIQVGSYNHFSSGKFSLPRATATVSGSGRCYNISPDWCSEQNQKFGFATGLYQQIAHLFAGFHKLQDEDRHDALCRRVLELSSSSDILCCVELCLDSLVRKTLLEMGACYVVHQKHLELLEDVPDGVVTYPILLQLGAGAGSYDLVCRFFDQARELGGVNVALVKRSDAGQSLEPIILTITDKREALKEEQLLPESPWYCLLCQGGGCETCDGSGAGELACSVEVFAVSYIQTLTKTPRELEELLSCFWDEGNFLELLKSSGVSQVSGEVDDLKSVAHFLEHNLSLLIAAGLGDIRLNASYQQLTEVERILERLCFYCALHVVDGTFLLDQLTYNPGKAPAKSLLDCLEKIIALGNTVVAVGPIPGALSRADYLIEFGEASGSDGGEIIRAGWVDKLQQTPERVVVKGSRFADFADLSLATGIVAGKVITTLSDISKVDILQEFINQQDGFGRTTAAELKVSRGISLFPGSRSSVAVITGLMEVVRKCFAKTVEASVRGLKEKDFSLSRSSYLCGSCKGRGWRTDSEICPVCCGGRFSATISEIRLREYAFHEVCALDLATLNDVFSGYVPIIRLSHPLVVLGLGHIHLEQPYMTLSSGEQARLSVFLGMPSGKKPQIAAFDFSEVVLPYDVRQSIYRALDYSAGQGHTIILRE
ncbi:MAG: hypothetical protein PHC51_00085 [bacterium]|nr:hypothetical protein [bacterium]